MAVWPAGLGWRNTDEYVNSVSFGSKNVMLRADSISQRVQLSDHLEGFCAITQHVTIGLQSPTEAASG